MPTGLSALLDDPEPRGCAPLDTPHIFCEEGTHIEKFCFSMSVSFLKMAQGIMSYQH